MGDRIHFSECVKIWRCGYNVHLLDSIADHASRLTDINDSWIMAIQSLARHYRNSVQPASSNQIPDNTYPDSYAANAFVEMINGLSEGRDDIPRLRHYDARTYGRYACMRSESLFIDSLRVPYQASVFYDTDTNPMLIIKRLGQRLALSLIELQIGHRAGSVIYPPGSIFLPRQAGRHSPSALRFLRLSQWALPVHELGQTVLPSYTDMTSIPDIESIAKLAKNSR